MSVAIEVKGLKEILARFDRLPEQVRKALRVNMEASLRVLHESVPPYPEANTDSTYRRTGTLGRTLGSSIGGEKEGDPQIFEVKEFGSGVVGRFGTRLEYAPHVIGETEQAEVHKGRWWTIKTIAEKSKDKLERIWKNVADALARYLEKGQ